MNILIQFIDNKMPFKDRTKEQLLSICVEKSYSKGENFLNIGRYCNHFLFINNVLVKLSFDADGEEFIMRFFQENILFTKLESLTNNRQGNYEIKALEDVNCVLISYSKFEAFCKEN